MQCKWCDDAAYIKQGHIWLCKKHYRFQQMRAKAKRANKTVPTYEELEVLWAYTNGSCPICHRSMNWMSKEGTATVASLQHDRSGNHRIICLSCNVRHASFKDDSFYDEDPNTRVCPRCKRRLTWASFTADNHGRWNNKNTYCRDCRRAMLSAWVSKNREVYNAKRRAYYHARKESGNPIPR